MDKRRMNCDVDDEVQEAVWRSVFFRIEWSLDSTLDSAVYLGLGGSLNAAVFRAINDATWHGPDYPGLQDYLSEVRDV